MFEENADEPDVMNEINTTPLIDVMLVLLIMLIITIPLQPHAVRLDTPSAPPPAQAAPPPAISIVVSADGTLRWNGDILAGSEALELRLAEAAKAAPQPELQVAPEAKAAYGRVAQVLAGAQRHGLTRIGVAGSEAER